MTICTGLERDAGTTSRAYVIIVGADHTQTQRLWLDLPDGRRGFQAGSLERFESRGSDVGEIKKVEVREGRRGGGGWGWGGTGGGTRLTAASVPRSAAGPRRGHSRELLVGGRAVCRRADQRGQIRLRLQVLAGQGSRGRADFQGVQRAGRGGRFHQQEGGWAEETSMKTRTERGK